MEKKKPLERDSDYIGTAVYYGEDERLISYVTYKVRIFNVKEGRIAIKIIEGSREGIVLQYDNIGVFLNNWKNIESKS